MKFSFLFAAIFSTSALFAQGPFLGRTVGELPYLEYGTGDDRLGGAKMTYLDTAVLIKVSG